MFFLTTSGSPYEMGVQIGRAHQYLIGGMLDFLGKASRRWSDREFQRSRERHMSWTEKLFPEIIEEVSGIAEGSGHSFRSVYTINFYSVLRPPVMGCTDIVFPRTAEGPLLAKVNDMPVHEGKHAGIRLLRPANGPAMIGGSYPGTCWLEPAMNEAGLALGTASCTADTPAVEQFLPPHVLVRYVLSKASTTAEALRVLEGLPLGKWGMNMAVVDRRGKAAVVEKSGTVQGVRLSGGEPIFCTDHMCKTRVMLKYCDRDPAKRARKMARYRTIQRLLRGRRPSRPLLKTILAANNVPGAVCRYGDNDPEHYETEFAAILRPQTGDLEVCFSHADRDPWVAFRLA